MFEVVWGLFKGDRTLWRVSVGSSLSLDMIGGVSGWLDLL